MASPRSPVPIPNFSAGDIATMAGGTSTFEAGRQYQRDGRARIVSIDPGGRRIVGEVRGTAPAPYRQDIGIYASRGSVVFTTACSCRVSVRCKHSIALLLEFLAQDTSEVGPYLTPELGSWLDGFEKAVSRGAHHDAVGSNVARQQIVYLVECASNPDGVPTTVVAPVMVRFDKDGGSSGEPKPYDAASAAGAPAKYVADVDVAILASRATKLRAHDRAMYELSSSADSELFDRIIATGRARWRSPGSPPLILGPAREGKIVWNIDAEGAQAAAVRVLARPGERGPPMVLPMAPPRWLDPSTGEVCRIETGLSPVVAGGLLRAPLMPPHAVEPMVQRLSKLGLKGEHLPRVLGGPEPLAVTPTPIASVMMGEVVSRAVRRPVRRSSRGWYDEDDEDIEDMPVVRLGYDYAGRRLGAHSGDGPFTMLVDGRLARVARVSRKEASFGKRLTTAGLVRLNKQPRVILMPEQSLDYAIGSGSDAAVATFLLETRRQLETEGWRVEVDEDFPLRIAVADDASWRVEIGDRGGGQSFGGLDGSETDWFDTALGIDVNGRRVDILPAVLAMLRVLPPYVDPADFYDPPVETRASSAYATIPLDDGRTLALPYARLRPVLSVLWQLFARDDIVGSGGGLRVGRWQAAEVAALGGAEGLTVLAPDRVARLARELAVAPDAVPTRLPDDFSATLRPYQQAGVDRMQRLARAEFGLVLADDMGLGKTVQTLAHLAVEHAAGALDAPALVIAPTSVLPNWVSEAAAFAPALRVHLWSGPDRKDNLDALDSVDLVVTSYPLLARDTDVLSRRRWSIVVADEAQFVRNPATAAAQALFGLIRRQTIALTGTPVENSLGDIWSIAHATNPGLLGSAKDFVRRYRTPIERRGDEHARRMLAHRLRPFLLRRTKDEVAPELPPKTEIAETVVLEGAQAALYEAVRLAMHVRVQDAIADKGLARSRIVVLDALLKLRQACCNPRLVKIALPAKKTATRPGTATGSAKLVRLLELLATFREEGRAVLLFSQFTSMLELIRAELDAQERQYAWLTGDTVDRKTPVQRFQSGEVDLFLVSLKAGGTGLTLTAADAVILYDPWWNPAVEAQAIDRAHRIGQAKPVFVHRLIASGTIEEKMLALQGRKRELAAALWDADDPGSRALDQLTAEDVMGLFA